MIAALDRETIKALHSLALGLQICLRLDKDGISKTPLDPTWMVVS